MKFLIILTTFISCSHHLHGLTGLRWTGAGSGQGKLTVCEIIVYLEVIDLNERVCPIRCDMGSYHEFLEAFS
jgi:hypothetical protein